MKYPKKVIAAGPGNPPVLIDETADLKLAAIEITQSASYDNNILCIAEKEIFVVDKVAHRLKREMIANGAFELEDVFGIRYLDNVYVFLTYFIERVEIPEETFNVVLYSFLGLHKVLIVAFFAIPYVALAIIAG